MGDSKGHCLFSAGQRNALQALFHLCQKHQDPFNLDLAVRVAIPDISNSNRKMRTVQSVGVVG